MSSDNILSEKSAAGIKAREEAMDLLINELSPTLTALYGRWLDEREYEDFAEYAKVMNTLCDRVKIKLIKANKRPFGITFRPNGFPYVVQVSVNMSSISWKSVK